MKISIRKPFDGDFKVTFKFGEAPQWYLDAIGYPHNGTDFALPGMTAVLACDDGVVEQVDFHPLGWGVFVRIRHSWGMSHYAHLTRAQVNIGQEVKQAQQIALSGHTGFTIGPHLHFGIKVDGVLNPEMKDWVNPEDYLDREVAPEVIKCPNCGFCFPKGTGV